MEYPALLPATRIIGGEDPLAEISREIESVLQR